MNTKFVEIEIERDENYFPVSIEVLSEYKGRNTEDDPNSVELALVGEDDAGNLYNLQNSEILAATEKFLSNNVLA